MPLTRERNKLSRVSRLDGDDAGARLRRPQAREPRARRRENSRERHRPREECPVEISSSDIAGGFKLAVRPEMIRVSASLRNSERRTRKFTTPRYLSAAAEAPRDTIYDGFTPDCAGY